MFLLNGGMLSESPHSVTTQKTDIENFTAVKTPVL